MPISKSNAKIIRYLDTGIFNAVILFSVNFTYDELIYRIKKHGDWAKAIAHDKELIDGSSYFALHREIEFKKTGKKYDHFYIILTKPFTFTDDEMCVLAHEILHICQFLLPTYLDRNREIEAEAYLHTHIMKQCLRELREAYKK